MVAKHILCVKGWEIDSDDFEWHNSPKFHSWMDAIICNNKLNRIYFTGGEEKTTGL